MVFNSLTFAVFFAIVLMLHALPLAWTTKKANLLLASYLFYAAWSPPFVLLLWLSTAVDWWAARQIAQASTPWRRRLWLIVSLGANLGMLGWFKYGEFILGNTQVLAASVGIDYQPPAWDFVLPVGISFYTFATLSYTLDVYLRRTAPCRSLLDFSLFVTFFPHLVAGPIMRASQLLPQFQAPRTASGEQLRFGLALITLGLFQKVVLADGFLSGPADIVFGADQRVGWLDAWVGTLAFGGQIFCDFAGYSTTAIGVALCLGFAMPDNFRFPCAAIGFTDFWRRWHISLSTWLRDYLYIPLGGNRHGPARTALALMLTMLLGGLWHGANWTFVVWGERRSSADRDRRRLAHPVRQQSRSLRRADRNSSDPVGADRRSAAAFCCSVRWSTGWPSSTTVIASAIYCCAWIAAGGRRRGAVPGGLEDRRGRR